MIPTEPRGPARPGGPPPPATPAPRRGEGPSAPGSGPGRPANLLPGDEVALSSGAEAFRHARTRLDGVVAVPSDRVAALRARVAGGTYRVDGERIAATMLEDEATARLLGLGNGR